ncbi:MAG: hypothetical protein ACREGA_02100 [Candidatus Saccharimonadales bacterium]
MGYPENISGFDDTGLAIAPLDVPEPCRKCPAMAELIEDYDNLNRRYQHVRTIAELDIMPGMPGEMRSQLIAMLQREQTCQLQRDGMSPELVVDKVEAANHAGQ